MDYANLDQLVITANTRAYQVVSYWPAESPKESGVLAPGFMLKASTKLPKIEHMPEPQSKQSPDPLVREIELALKGQSFDLYVRDETLKIGGSEYKIPAYSFKDSKKVMSELRALAKTDKIRVFFPNSMGTQDYVEGRVNFLFDAQGRFQRCFKG